MIERKKERQALLIGVMAITLFAGLNPEDYDFRNNVSRSADNSGLEFERYGVAFTEPFILRDIGDTFARHGFTITLTLGPEPEVQDGFAFIAQIHAGDDRSQLVIGRWTDHVIVMNRDDYENRLRGPRIAARIDRSTRGVRSVAVTSGASGTRLYVDGRMMNERPDLVLTIPSNPPGGRIVLGNSVHGTHPWRGVIRDFALYDRVLSADEIGARLDPGMNGGSSPPAEVDGVVVHFAAGASATGILPVRSKDGVHLEIPERWVVVEKQFFQHPFTRRFELDRSFVSDFVVNLLGFIPLGAALSLLFAGLGLRGIRSVLIVTVCAAALSAGIEIAQAWMPSRTSSLLDLVLNIAGGFTGVLIVVAGHDMATKRAGSGRAARTRPSDRFP